MKFEYTEVSGFLPAIIGMRLPMSKNFKDAKTKTTSGPCKKVSCENCVTASKTDNCKKIESSDFQFTKEDLRVAQNLIRADGKGSCGTPNSKFLQMIEVWVSIEAPLSFWSEFDTYRHMVKNSTSKMHKLHSYPIDEDCFEKNPLTKKVSDLVDIKKLEKQRQKYNKTKDKKDWYELNDAIPSSWLQTRMCHFNYQTLRNIIMWRKNHKLNCWSGKDNSDMEYFIKWAKTLPFADELLFYEGVNKNDLS